MNRFIGGQVRHRVYPLGVKSGCCKPAYFGMAHSDAFCTRMIAATTISLSCDAFGAWSKHSGSHRVRSSRFVSIPMCDTVCSGSVHENGKGDVNGYAMYSQDIQIALELVHENRPTLCFS